MQILRNLAPLLPTHLLAPLAPLAPLGIKQFFGRFLACISAQVWRNIAKNTKNADFKNTGPPADPRLLAPWPPWGSKKILGGFWHVSQLKFEETSPKIPRMQILRKLAPLLPPWLLIAPGPPGVQKIFREASGIYLSSTLKKYHQKYQECRF